VIDDSKENAQGADISPVTPTEGAPGDTCVSGAELPTYAPMSAAIIEEPVKTPAKVRITLIDDEPSVLFALKLLLEALGFAITDFSDPEAALTHLGTPNVADVCLCDLRMPKRNGLQVLEAAKGIDSGLPFILMSAHASDSELQKARTLGADAVLTKPFTPDDLQAALAAVRRKTPALPNP